MPGTMISHLIDERFTCKFSCIHIALWYPNDTMSRNDFSGYDQNEKETIG